ncbi:GNAT family N-acetyltransferase [Paenibacillus sp. TH7-28]
MSTSISIKQAGQEDLEGLAVLFNEYRIFYEQTSDMEGATRFLSERLSRNESVVFLAVDQVNQTPVGFTQLYPSFSSISMNRLWVLNDLYVREEYRKQGAGKLLLEAARTYALQTNAKGLELSTAIANERAQRLYEKSGYIKDTEFYHYFLTL